MEGGQAGSSVCEGLRWKGGITDNQVTHGGASVGRRKVFRFRFGA